MASGRRRPRARRRDGRSRFSIPTQTLSFKPGLHEWHFNVQRRIQRLLETDRWAFPARQYQITQTSRAGLLTGLAGVQPGSRPERATRDHGRRRYPRALGSRRGRANRASTSRSESARICWRRYRQHRFRRDRGRHTSDKPDPVSAFLPEKRTFFLEGADTFTFGSWTRPGHHSVLQPPRRPRRRQ